MPHADDGQARAFAPAKINLFLHVGPLRADGFHPICSLMVFADVGDVLTLTPAEAWSLEVEGDFAGGAPATHDNLVLRAARAAAREQGGAFTLTKQIPVGAGLGGGSADAAAAMRLLAGGAEPATLHRLAAGLGSDVPACLASRPVLAEGRGEVLLRGPAIAPTPAVLVYPSAPVSTAAVYRALDAGQGGSADRPAGLADCGAAQDVAALVLASRNDLEPVAVALEPVVAEALALLRGSSDALAARMSGSGSACFAVCPSDEAARRLARSIAQRRPHWWVKPCRMGGEPLSSTPAQR